MSKSPAYWDGYDHGRDQAVLCCFGGSKMRRPSYETSQEESDYEDGYDDGYSSVDD